MAKFKKGYVLAVAKIRVDRGDHHEEFKRGDSCDTIPVDTLQRLIDFGDAVTQEEFEVLEAPEVDAGDWKQTEVVALGLSQSATDALIEAGLTDVQSVLEFGADNEGSLQSIDGVGEVTEKDIKEAIAALANS